MSEVDFEQVKKDILDTADMMTYRDVPEAVDILCRLIDRMSLNRECYQTAAAQILRSFV
jgi:hypothetical protein